MRNALLQITDLNQASNASLLMSRYVKLDNPESRSSLFDSMRSAASNARSLYAQAFDIRHENLSKIAMPVNFKTSQPLISGLGNSSVLEVGLSLNRIYGMPLIPGSAIKGITAHYCSEVFGKEDPRYKGPEYDEEGNNIVNPGGEIYEALFGKAYPEDDQAAGSLIFYDAWICPEFAARSLTNDIMTPHNTKYYESRGNNNNRPSDFEKPIPVSFLTVKTGCEFEFWIGSRNFEQDKAWIEHAFKITEAALKESGIGAKSSSAYGRMTRILTPEEQQVQEREARRAKDREAGFSHSIGDIVEAVCTGIKVFKGSEKLQFAMADTSDTVKVSFNPRPKATQGDIIKAQVISLDHNAKAYVLRAL